MALKMIKLQVVDILGTNYTCPELCFSESRVLNHGETFKEVVKEAVQAFIVESDLDGDIEDIEWINDTNASIQFDEDGEFVVVFSLIEHDVIIDID